jgi:PAS domain S-box-containing protein
MLTTDLKRYSQLIVENIHDVIWVLDPSDLHFSFVTDSNCALLGFLPDEMIKKTLRDVVVKKSYIKILECMCEFETAFQLTKHKNIDIELTDKKGKTIPAEISITFVRNEMDHVTSFVCVLRDITQRKIADESLKKLDNALQYIITQTSQKIGTEYFNAMVLALCKCLEADYAHIGILQPDKEHIRTIALCHKKEILPNIEYTLTGSPCKTVLDNLTCTYQKNVSDLFPQELVLKSLKIEGYVGVPLYTKSQDRLGIMVCLFKKPIADSELPETVINLFSDRVEIEYDRLMAQEQLELALKKAEESDRLKSMFLQNMSHEIRTPMNAIIGFGELLADNFDNKNKLSTYSHIIQQRSHDLLELINDILDLSRIESGQQAVYFEACDLNMLFDEMNEMFQVYKKEKDKNGIQLIFYPICDPRQSVIITDKVKLRQIFINLINNAFKFTEHGKIEVGCSFSSANNMEFYVADTGKGIPLDKHELIFNRFMQVNNTVDHPQKGTGLGLAIVKGLVELLGGEIKVKSTPGQGSRFSFSFAYQSTLMQETPVIKPEVNDLKEFSKKTLLIVEDDEFSAQYIEELLADSGLKIHRVKTGPEAIRYVEQKLVDIILMDIRLPEINGYEVTRTLKSQWPQIKIIAQTAYAMQDERHKALEAGCDDYLSKPVVKNILFNMIHTQLSK